MRKPKGEVVNFQEFKENKRQLEEEREELLNLIKKIVTTKQRVIITLYLYLYNLKEIKTFLNHSYNFEIDQIHLNHLILLLLSFQNQNF